MRQKRADVYKSGHENYSELDTMRHSAAHLMAAAVMELYPGAKLGYGPTTEDGFYYDFQLPQKVSENDFAAIEAKMNELKGKNLPFVRQEVQAQDELARAKEEHQPFKEETIAELAAKGEAITVYEMGSFRDVCKGPHVKTTGEIGEFKLLSIAGAYWKGSEKNPMLTRIYATAFAAKADLDEYLARLEIAKERDHRVIGKKLGLFVFSDLVGKGLPLLTPKGAAIRRELERFIIDEEIKRGYQHVLTPPLAKTDLYKTSGHYPYYKDTMYPTMTVEEDELILRPMTCPHHFMLYTSQPRSYRDLPMRIAECADLFRYEKSGELTGLMRVRMFCLADAHIVATKEQATDEIKGVLDLISFANKIFGMEKGKDYQYRLSLGDRSDTKKYFKDDAAWDEAEEILRNVLKESDVPYYEAPNEAAFYGPKIDIQVKNVMGKEETAFTVQYDFVMPTRFNMTYTDSDGKEKRPIVIHRSSIGAFERTMAFLMEKFAGNFPTWLSPIQAKILPIGERHGQYANEVLKRCIDRSIRAEVDGRSEKLSAKIRDAQLEKAAYMLIIGDKEVAANTVSVRRRNGTDVGSMDIPAFLAMIAGEITSKALPQ